MNKLSDTKLEEKLRALGREIKIPAHLQAELKAEILEKVLNTPILPKKTGRQPLWNLAPGIAALGIFLLSGTAVLADSAKPGDVLYPVDTFVESISQRLVKDESAKAKLYASLGDERVEELEALSAKPATDLSAEKAKKAEENKAIAKERAEASLEILTQVQAAVQEKYETSDNPAKKDAMLRLGKHLEQVKERRLDRLRKLTPSEETPDAEADAVAKSQLKARVNEAIKNAVRREFHIPSPTPNEGDEDPVDQPKEEPSYYQINDPNIPEDLQPPMRDIDEDGIPDNDDQWIPRPLRSLIPGL